MNEKLEEVLKRFKEATKKDCYMIKCIEGETGIFDSKIGGIPYIPVNEKYPVDKKGNPMPLFVQINFENCALENYPNKGIWEIFVSKELPYPAEYEIRYYEDISKEYMQEIPKIDLSQFIVETSIKIELVPNETYMPLRDFRFNETFSKIFNEEFGSNVANVWEIDDIVGKTDACMDFLNGLEIKTGLVGGYADFTQTDPRTYDNKNMTECILKIDSQLNDDLMIGDAGIAWILMTKEDLINKKFENGIFDWDCC